MRRMTSNAFPAERIERVVTREERSRRSVWFIACDRPPTDRVLQLPIDEIPPYATDEDRRELAGFLADAIAHIGSRAGLAVLTRPGGPTVAEIDRRWYRAIRDAWDHRLPLLGVHLFTPGGSRELFFDDVV
jgi:hypothetical protein